jgi:hypothetical protein
MIKKLSRYFKIPVSNFRRVGVFDAFIGIDNQLFVDPTLLRNAKTPEFTGSRDKLEKYFADVFTLLVASNRHGIGSNLGISLAYAVQVRSGKRVPHPRHWQTLAQLVGISKA